MHILIGNTELKNSPVLVTIIKSDEQLRLEELEKEKKEQQEKS
jgi:hypothetical protein